VGRCDSCFTRQSATGAAMARNLCTGLYYSLPGSRAFRLQSCFCEFEIRDSQQNDSLQLGHVGLVFRRREVLFQLLQRSTERLNNL
jgi:hypothetical protein